MEGVHVRTRANRTARFILAGAGLVLWLSASARCEPGAPAGGGRQPRNIYELIYSSEHTFAKTLKAEEFDEYRAWSPEHLRQADPELYERISRDIRAWTLHWIHYVRTSLVPLPEKRLNAAQRTADQVDGILRTHFETRGWPYKQMQVVFLPPQVFLDERHREMLTSGMFIPYFPEAFFVSVDWPVPMELVLVHESLHFNKIGTAFGQPLAEGITETGARYLALKYKLLTPYATKRVDTYPRERKGVELVLEEIMKKTARSRDDAVELFLGAYLTGNQDGMSEVFGTETWRRIVNLSHSPGSWQTHRIKEVLEKEP